MNSTKLRRFAKKVLPSYAIRMLRPREQTRRQALGPGRDSHLTSGDTPEHLEPDVAHLEDRLWLGYETASLAKLAGLAAISRVHSSVRADAALALARWEMARGGFESALEHLDLSMSTLGDVDTEPAALGADCLCRLGRGREALSRLSPLLDRRAVDPDISIRVGSARSLIEENRSYGSGSLVGELNRLYIARGLVTVSRRDVSTPVGIENLTGAAPGKEPSEKSVLVSVLVPCFNGAETITAAIESLRAQSWDNFEIVVVDDSSTDGTNDAVRSLMREDPRIVLVENPVRSGEYFSRNVGVGVATGDFITVQHANEWSHPQRLELQATVLASSPQVAAVGSHCIKVEDDLLLRQPTGRPEVSIVGRNHNSLMFRRGVFDEIGLWDDVPAPADEEFCQRLQAWFGIDAVDWVEPEIPMSIMKYSASSTPDAETAGLPTDHVLSAASRYRDAYTWWHASRGFRSTLPYRPGPTPRPFATPANGDSTSGRPEDLALSVVMMGDFGGDNDATAAFLGLLDQLLGEAGLVHIPAFESRSRQASPVFHALAASDRVKFLGLLPRIDCRILFVSASVLTSPRFDQLPSVTAEEAYLIQPETPFVPTPTNLEVTALEKWAGVSFGVVAHDRNGLVGAPPWA